MNISKQAVLEIINTHTEKHGIYFCDLLVKRINALPSISDGWISVEDRLPEMRTDMLQSDYVITYSAKNGRRLGILHSFDDGFKWGIQYTGGYSTDTTHWQPLPPAPTK